MSNQLFLGKVSDLDTNFHRSWRSGEGVSREEGLIPEKVLIYWFLFFSNI